jgi:ImcF (intracellular multiplication and macrophage-killing)-related protein
MFEFLKNWFSPFRYMWKVLVPARFRPEGMVGLARGKLEKGAEKAVSGWRRFWAVLRWVLHILLVAAILVGLWYANDRLDLERILGGPWPFLRTIWLPLLFLLFYVLCWLGAWLWYLLGPEHETGEFPDLLVAWTEGTRSLGQAGIDITHAPLFLVLGRPRDGEELLFGPAKIHFPVRGVPQERAAPLRVYANHQGIFVSCSMDSLSDQPSQQADAPSTPSNGAAAKPEVVTLESQPMLVPVGGAEEGTTPAGMVNEGEQAVEPVQVALPDESAGAAAPATPLRPVRKQEETERIIRRLRYLCGLIARARRPYCPANGILLAEPLTATDSDPAANQAASDVHRALTTARDTLQVHCPVILLLCEMERLSGFRELLALLPENQRQRLLGQPFPLAPDIQADQVPAMLEGGVRWTTETMLPALAYRLMRLEPLNGDGKIDGMEVARRLYDLLHALWEREHRIAQILARAAATQGNGPPLLGGCYFAATGPDPVREQGFVPAVFSQLIASQDAVVWTDEARAENAAYRRWTLYGYIAIALFVASLAVAAYFVYF